jgi:hypothetical protein
VANNAAGDNQSEGRLFSRPFFVAAPTGCDPPGATGRMFNGGLTAPKAAAIAAAPFSKAVASMQQKVVKDPDILRLDFGFYFEHCVLGSPIFALRAAPD